MILAQTVQPRCKSCPGPRRQPFTAVHKPVTSSKVYNPLDHGATRVADRSQWPQFVESGLAAFGCERLEKTHAILQAAPMHSWSPGYTQAELDEAQERYALRFPPDLIELFLDRQPTHGYNWRIEDSRIRQILNWPLMRLLSGVGNGFWWPSWGLRPESQNARAEVVTEAIGAAPRLIPILGHRFIPESPHEAGNPVFSMHGFDTIYYGANLSEYFSHEFEGKHGFGVPRHVPFWSDLAERSGDAYAFYEASGGAEAARAKLERCC